MWHQAQQIFDLFFTFDIFPQYMVFDGTSSKLVDISNVKLNLPLSVECVLKWSV